MPVYLDNAATTPLDKEVLEAMMPYLEGHFGNPSSIHSHGREVRSAIEKARKKIASLLNTSPSEIFFTSGGTEADNMAIRGSVQAYGVKHVVTTPIEHHAVLHTLEDLEKRGQIKIHYASLDERGRILMDQLEILIQRNPGALVSIMHANNEVANLNDIEGIGNLAKKYKCLFHSDTVQTMGHFVHDLQKLRIDYIVGSAHKFHGPKGTGFIYVNNESKIPPLVHGGSQERNMRGGTENVYGIIGLAKALEIAYRDLDDHRRHVQGLKDRMAQRLKEQIPGVVFNGDCLESDKSLYTVLSVGLPKHEINEMLLFNLDIHNISASGGSACSSGTDIGSHVLNFLQADPERGHVRFSFSKFNTAAEVDFVVEKLAEMYR